MTHVPLVLAALAVAAPPPTDAGGDPLPPGAVARLGSVRFRQPWFTSAVPSPDGTALAVHTPSGYVLIDAVTGRELRTYAPPAGAGGGGNTTFTRDGRRLVALGSNGAVAWDAATGAVVADHALRTPEYGQVGDVSADGNVVAFGAPGWGRPRNEAVVRDLRGGREVGRFPVVQNGGGWAALTPDGNVLATGGDHVDQEPRPGAAADRTAGVVQLWDVATGKELRRIETGIVGSGTGTFSPDGKHLATAGAGSPVELWDAATGRRVRRFETTLDAAVRVEFAPDGKRLGAVLWSGRVVVWETATGREVAAGRSPFTLAAGRWTGVRLAFPGDRVLAAVSDGNGYGLWDVRADRLLTPDHGHRWAVVGLRFAPDGRSLLSLGADFAVGRWPLATASPRQEWVRLPGVEQDRGIQFSAPTPEHGRGFSHDATALVLPTYRGGYAVHDLATGAERFRLTLPADTFGNFEPGPAAFTRAGSRVVGIGRGYAADGRPRAVAALWNAETGQPAARKPVELGESVAHPVVTPEGTRLVALVTNRVANPGNGPPHVTELASFDIVFGKKITTAPPPRPGESAELLAFAPDGRTVVGMTTRRESHLRPVDDPHPGNFFLWDADTGQVVRDAARPAGRRTSPVAGRRGGRMFAAGFVRAPGAVPVVRVIEWSTLGERAVFAGHAPGHPSQVLAVAFAPDGRRLASGGTDTTGLVWDLAAAPAPGPGGPAPPETLWAELGSADAAAAWRAIRGLVARPGAAVALVRDRLRPAAGRAAPDRADVPALVRQLDAPAFADREAAARDLQALGWQVEDDLRAALRVTASAEVRDRLERILTRLGRPTTEDVRHARAVEVLERIASPAAVAALDELAAGPPIARLTREAKEAHGRLRPGR